MIERRMPRSRLCVTVLLVREDTATQSRDRGTRQITELPERNSHRNIFLLMSVADPSSELTPATDHLRRDLFLLVLPVLAEQLLIFGIGFFDTLLSGQLGKAETSAIGLAAYVSWLGSVIFGVVGVGSNAIVARHWGAGANEPFCRGLDWRLGGHFRRPRVFRQDATDLRDWDEQFRPELHRADRAGVCVAPPAPTASTGHDFCALYGGVFGLDCGDYGHVLLLGLLLCEACNDAQAQHFELTDPQGWLCVSPCGLPDHATVSLDLELWRLGFGVFGWARLGCAARSCTLTDPLLDFLFQPADGTASDGKRLREFVCVHGGVKAGLALSSDFQDFRQPKNFAGHI